MSNTKEFCDWLRKAAELLASGEKPEIFLSDFNLDQAFPDEADRKKISPAYMRNTMNRVGDVKAVGAVSVKRVKPDDENVGGFMFTLNREKKRRVITNDDIPAIEAAAVAKAVKRIVEVMPNLTSLSGEELQGAVKGIAMYQAMIKEMTNE